MSKRRLVIEGLEQRQLLVGTPLADMVDPGTLRTLFLTGDFVSREARVAAEQRYGFSNDSAGLAAGFFGDRAGPGTGGGNGPVNFTEVESNDTSLQAQPIALGNGPGQSPSVNVSGAFTPTAAGFTADVDYYRFSLKAGDIFNAQGNAAASDLSFIKLNANGSLGTEYAGNDLPIGALTPGSSPLLTGGTASLAVVVPEDGEYVLRVGTSAVQFSVAGQYTLNLRTFRPEIESKPIGTHQIIYLDFDGSIFDLSEIALGTGTLRIPPFEEAMDNLGFQAQDADPLITRILAEVDENFNDLGFVGNNGNYGLTGTPGEYKVTILNSRDHQDPWGLENVSRVLIGGTDVVFGGAVFGVASSVDIGNFDLEETALVFPEMYAGIEAAIDGLAPGSSLVDLYGTAMGLTISHEIGHYLGGSHQINTNSNNVIMDTGGNLPGRLGVGPDLIFGSEDDRDTDFGVDRYDAAASVIQFGTHDTINAFAFGLGSGKVGATISGAVYNDVNRNAARGASEAGLAGITVFSDLDGDGVLDSNEPSAITGSNGAYSILVGPGQQTIRVVPSSGFAATTPIAVPVNVAIGGGASVSYGLARVNSDVTGFKWNDINGNGLREADEPGIAGVFVYLDLDGDDRLDLFEPQARTAEDGSYSINFPSAGTYTIREVVAPGFVQTFPASGEHIVVYNGTVLGDNYNFGNRSVQDFGDAPNTGLFSFPTTGSNAAVAGIVSGLSIGALVDAESAGQPTLGADGDDSNGSDDEDGVTLRSQLAPGATTTFDVAVQNTTGVSAYLSAWLDINGDGDWNDAGEKFATDVLVSASGTIPLTVSLPGTAALGDTYARFRLSQTQGVGAGGFTAGGEIEDYRYTIAESPDLANDDAFDVPRGALSFPLNVLANDFDPAFDPLVIESVDTNGTRGQVIISQDRRRIFYTPPSNSLGPDSFVYTVSNTSGTDSDTATVDLNVVFQSAVPIAVDDSFNIPQGVGNQPLNVLANDIVSVAEGGLRIIATSAGSAGGTIQITSGGQSIRYTPAAGFAGTEQFTYTVSDTAGEVSSAEVTVHLQPGAQADDLASFIVETFANDGVTPINTIPAGERFKLRVSVDDLRNLTGIQGAGLSAAYLDLLYTDGLVSTVASSVSGSGFPFEVSFGPLFSVVQTGDTLTPGMLNEIGATQSGLGTAFTGQAELFTITMLAVSPGIAEFVADPADAQVSDTVLLNDPTRELTPSEIRFGRRQLTIVPSNSNFTFAVDDSYPDQLDSNNAPIVAGTPARLNVLANDNRGPSGVIEIVSVGAPASGSVTVNDNGTPSNTSDDFLSYRANNGFVGVDQFTYTILSGDGIQSTAQVTVTVGNAAADDLVEILFNVTDLDGNAITADNPLQVGEQFNLEIFVDDLRAPAFGQARGVFAAYMDLLYNSTLAQPAPAAADNAVGQRLGFEVSFGDQFSEDPAVGDDLVPGLINEFGTFQTTAQGSGDPLQSDPVLLATVTMVALAPGNLRITADPADVSPFQDTLLYEPPDVVPISRIRYDVATVTISGGGGSGEGESPYQNGRDRMDVNDDGSVSPIDALLVLNRLNRGGEGEGDDGSSGGNRVFWDVNGDTRMSPIDALQVINHLNRSGSSAASEGEDAPPFGLASGANSAAGFASAADAVFGEIGGGEGEGLLVGGSAARVAPGSGQTSDYVLAGSDEDDDEEQSDEIGLLADIE